jgi:hypothetical protein
MYNVHPLGDFLETDPKGYLISGVSPDNLISPWREAVDYATRLEVSRWGKQLHSLYLRGSVALGKAVLNRSDIDLFAVLFDKESATHQVLPWSEQELEDFYIRFPFLTSIECSHISLAQVHGPFHYYRFVMKVSSLCIYGCDLLPTLDGYTTDAPIAEEWFRIFPHLVNRFILEMKESGDYKRRKRLCMDMMKTFLRSGMLLVMRRKSAYTRELYPSYQCFSDFYPEEESAMRRCLELAVNPICDQQTLLPFVTRLAEWMNGAAEAEFGSIELLPVSLIS